MTIGDLSLSTIVCETLAEMEDFLEFTEEIKLTSEGVWKGRQYKAILTISTITTASEGEGA